MQPMPCCAANTYAAPSSSLPRWFAPPQPSHCSARAADAAAVAWWTVVGAFPTYSFWLLFAGIAGTLCSAPDDLAAITATCSVRSAPCQLACLSESVVEFSKHACCSHPAVFLPAPQQDLLHRGCLGVDRQVLRRHRRRLLGVPPGPSHQNSHRRIEVRLNCGAFVLDGVRHGANSRAGLLVAPNPISRRNLLQAHPRHDPPLQF